MLLSRKWKIVFLAGAGVAVAALLVDYWEAHTSAPCESFLTGDAHRGGQLFYSKGCNSCHSLFDRGGGSAPDLGRRQTAGWRPVRIVAAMWSHGPEMWERFRQASMGYPRISEEDVRDLFAFLGSLQYLDAPGDPEQGREIFVKKHCTDCHEAQGSQPSIGPDLSRLDVETPILWAQRMWNHGEPMGSAMAKKEIPWPTFQAQQMVDLLAYVQSISSGVRREGRLLPAHPRNGRRLFNSKGCVVCHAINGRGGKVGPDLGSSHASPPTMIQFAGLMWNHAPRMWEKMKAGGVAPPKFAEQEMADLIAYLYEARYFEPEGSAGAGREVFESKGCTVCHGPDARGGKEGPSLRGITYCATRMAFAFWSHGPQMYRRMRAAHVSWPAFTEQEMVNLMAFLNRE